MTILDVRCVSAQHSTAEPDDLMAVYSMAKEEEADRMPEALQKVH